MTTFEQVTEEYIDSLSEEAVIYVGPNKKKKYYISRYCNEIKYYDDRGKELVADIDDVWKRNVK